MRKVSTCLMMAAAMVALPIVAQHVSTEPQHAKALLEEFTGIHCGNCPDGHRYAAKLLLAQPDSVIVICIHQGYYSTPYYGEPDFTTGAGNAIGAVFEPSGYPSGMINRHNYDAGTVIGRGTWTSYCRAACAQVAPVNLWMASSYDKETRRLTVQVEGYFTETVASGDARLAVALLQDNIQGPQSGGLMSNEYVHLHMLRDYLTDTWGSPVAGVAGTYIDTTIVYDVPDSIKAVAVVPTDLEVVAMVIDGQGSVLNAEASVPECAGITVPMAADIAACKIPVATSYGFDFLELYVTNKSTESITTATFALTLNGATTDIHWSGYVAPRSRAVVALPVDWRAVQMAEDNSFAVTMTAAGDTEVETSTVRGTFDALREVPTELVVKIKTDNYAAENTFYLRDARGTIVREFGPYPGGVAEEYVERVTLEADSVYCFEINDHWADGMMSPRGYFKLYDTDEQLVAQQKEVDGHGYRLFVVARDVTAGLDYTKDADAAIRYDAGCRTLVLTGATTAAVYDVTGRMVARRAATTLSTEGWPAGIYFVRAARTDGTQISLQFVVYSL